MKKLLYILSLCILSVCFIFYSVNVNEKLQEVQSNKEIIAFQLQQEKEKAKYYETLTKANEKQAEYYQMMIKRLRSENE